MATQDLSSGRSPRNERREVRRRARRDPRRPRLRQGLHRPHGRHLLVGEGRLAPSARAAVRPDRARPGRRRAALRAGDLRGAQGLPSRRRLDLDLPSRGERGRMQRSARRLALPELPDRVLHRVAQAAHRGRRRTGCPTQGETSLYLRPFMFAKEAFLGVRPAEEGQLLRDRAARGRLLPGRRRAGVDLAVDRLHPRRPRRHGPAKTGGNYASSLVAAAGGVRARLRAGAVPRRGGGQVPRGARRHERRARHKDGTLITPGVDSASSRASRSTRSCSSRATAGYTVEQRARSRSTSGATASQSGDIVEAFACGTAAVVTPIGAAQGARLHDRDAGCAAGELAMSLRQELTDIQYGRGEDRHGWMTRLDAWRLLDRASRTRRPHPRPRREARARGCTSWSPSNQRTSIAARGRSRPPRPRPPNGSRVPWQMSAGV